MNDIDTILEKIRLNSASHSINHKKRYMALKERLKWFRLPVIILSSLNSVFSVGLVAFMEQEIISVINCLMSLICGIIGSIELYLQINRDMEQELVSSKDFYTLAIDIYKFLSLRPENRPVAQKIFIDDTYNRYVKLIQSSLLLKKKLDDKLTNYKLIEIDGHIATSTEEISGLGDETPSSSDGSV